MHKISKVNYFLLFIIALSLLLVLALVLRVETQSPSSDLPTNVAVASAATVQATANAANTESEHNAIIVESISSIIDTGSTSEYDIHSILPSETPETNAQESANDYVDGRFDDRVPNETGTIMIPLFHRFIETYSGGDKSVTMTLDQFRSTLQNLYDLGYRPVSMDDYLSGHINLPKGCLPIVFTFDDGWGSQFQFIEEDGQRIVDPKTAVGVWEEFNKEHPDFALRGVFYLNLGRDQTFGTVGTLTERLQYLVDLGFELGNHTLDHANLRNASTQELQLQIAENQRLLSEALPGYEYKTLALPYGAYNKDTVSLLYSGEYNGTSYKNGAVFLAGAEPSPSSKSEDFNLSKPVARVLAAGITPEYMDFDWWIENQSLDRQYISAGATARSSSLTSTE